MGPLTDNTPLTNILTVAAAVAVGVGAWFLLWRLVDLLPAKLKQRLVLDREMYTLRAGFVAQQQLATQSEAPSTIDLGQPSPAKGRSGPPAWVAYLFLMIAVLAGIATLLWFANMLTFVRAAAAVQGKVVELRETRCQNEICYAPRVRFTEELGGRQVEFVSSMSSNPPAFHVGEKVTVLYSPEMPERAMVQGFFSIWAGIITLFILSVVFAILGACILLFPNFVASRYRNSRSLY